MIESACSALHDATFIKYANTAAPPFMTSSLPTSAPPASTLIVKMNPPLDLDAFKEWRDTRNRLKHSMHSFRDACTTLRQAIEGFTLSSVGHAAIEEIILNVHNQMDELDIIESTMMESRAVLYQVANRSTTLVPINVLPPEVLARVFSSAALTASCLYQSTSVHALHPLVVIPSVCARWRHLALNTPSFWSHIDIEEARISKNRGKLSLRRTELWVERARGAPLALDFWGKQSQQKQDKRQLTSILRRHVARIVSLSLHKTTEFFFRAMLSDLLPGRGRLSSLTTLVVDQVRLSRKIPHPTWPNPVLRNMFDLQLIDLPGPVSPGLNEFASLLSSSPHLHTLRLRNTQFSSGHEVECPTIILPHLRLLDLSIQRNPEFRKLVSVLNPGTLELEVQLNFSVGDPLGSESTIEALLQRSYVSRLVVRDSAQSDTQELIGYLNCLPDLRVLVLDFAKDYLSVTFDALLKRDFDGTIVARCPSLQALQILGGVVNSQAQHQLIQVIKTYSLEELAFKYRTSFFCNPGDLDMNGLFEWARRRVQNVVYDSEPRDIETEVCTL
ncbi:hypothetical protein FRC12_001649 [Ceratobasidium sp. 428]|nr:hypothetical protein FRC12_001649 [Ceratobasidium sp. 428]